MQAIHVVQAIQAYESKKRIPSELSGTTFFSQNDWWNYIKSFDPNMCHQCDFFGDMPFFSGDDLRLTFPNLLIVDENTIHPMVHPHCKCELQRVFRDLEPSLDLITDLGI